MTQNAMNEEVEEAEVEYTCKWMAVCGKEQIAVQSNRVSGDTLMIHRFSR